MLQHTKFQSVILTLILIVSLLSVIFSLVSCTQSPQSPLPPMHATEPYIPEGKLVDYSLYDTTPLFPSPTSCVFYPLISATDPLCDYAKSLRGR